MWTIWRLKWVDLATGIRFENMDVMDMDCCPAIRVPNLTPVLGTTYCHILQPFGKIDVSVFGM